MNLFTVGVRVVLRLTIVYNPMTVCTAGCCAAMVNDAIHGANGD